MAALLNLTLFGPHSFAGTAYPCTLQWQATPDPNVAGYALYYGVAGAPMTNRVDAGLATTVTVKTLTTSATYNFYVVAYDVGQVESGPSNLLPYSAAAISSLQINQASNGVMALSFRVAAETSCHVEYTDSLNPPVWNTLTNAVADSNGVVNVSDSVAASPVRFYRAVVP